MPAPEAISDAAVHVARRRIRARIQRLIDVSELVVVLAAEILMAIAIIIAGLILYALFVYGVATSLVKVNSLDQLQTDLQHVFAGVLLLVLGLELMKSLESFFVSFRVQVEIIVIVAMIAVARHILLIDFDHTPPAEVLAAAGLILALAISYVLVRQPRQPPPAQPAEAEDAKRPAEP
jgi:uncharacterized membrane protein (DUF373 family)